MYRTSIAHLSIFNRTNSISQHVSGWKIQPTMDNRWVEQRQRWGLKSTRPWAVTKGPRTSYGQVGMGGRAPRQTCYRASLKIDRKRSNIYRTHRVNLSNINRTSIQQQTTCNRTPLEHLSVFNRTHIGIRSNMYRTSIEHISNSGRTPIGHL